MSEFTDRVARALLESLTKQPKDGGNHGCFCEASSDLNVVIRGHVSLPDLVRVAMTAMRKPTEAMIDATYAGMYEPVDPEEAWGQMIDEALR